VRGLGAKRRSPLLTRPAKQACENRVRDRDFVVARAADDRPPSKVMKLAALHVEMLRIYCRDAELFAGNGAAGRFR
jgi:hypothetical protein